MIDLIAYVTIFTFLVAAKRAAKRTGILDAVHH